MKTLKALVALGCAAFVGGHAFADPFKVSIEMMERFDLQSESSEALPGEKLFLQVHYYGGDMRPECRDAPEDQQPLECDLLTPLITYEVKEWTVNGIRNGNGDVGAISGLTDGRVTYIAPSEPPQRNPVAVTAKVRVGEQDVLVSTEITVRPPNKWEGYVTYNFEADYQENDPATNSVTNGKVKFFGAYEVDEVLSDSYGDDGTGVVFLAIAPREAEYEFNEKTRDDCERTSSMRGSFLKGLKMPPPNQTLNLTVGKEGLEFANVMPMPIEAEGEWHVRNCTNDKGLEGSGDAEAFVNVDMLIDSGFKARLNGGTYHGSLQEDRTLSIASKEFQGTLTMEWVFKRHN
ncbi:hypothetical protein [Gimibacter soli]|uniref:Uncharacterized protein n=1 Tax=Gimibacter soli TaxID=3024400 RepID=A0AAE9XQN3_9PROT|nr:hypothetical protein [Gimibacter soli]WCL53316.1 hypothetical protein PH603_12290 [Gimibacter soli]